MCTKLYHATKCTFDWRERKRWLNWIFLDDCLKSHQPTRDWNYKSHCSGLIKRTLAGRWADMAATQSGRQGGKNIRLFSGKLLFASSRWETRLNRQESGHLASRMLPSGKISANTIHSQQGLQPITNRLYKTNTTNTRIFKMSMENAGYWEKSMHRFQICLHQNKLIFWEQTPSLKTKTTKYLHSIPDSSSWLWLLTPAFCERRPWEATMVTQAICFFSLHRRPRWYSQLLAAASIQPATGHCQPLASELADRHFASFCSYSLPAS